jgi:hypothetical protein
LNPEALDAETQCARRGSLEDVVLDFRPAFLSGDFNLDHEIFPIGELTVEHHIPRDAGHKSWQAFHVLERALLTFTFAFSTDWQVLTRAAAGLLVLFLTESLMHT